MRMTLKEALKKLAQITGNDETMIKDNANYPITIYHAIDEIDIADDHIGNFAVNSDGIFIINQDGFIDQIPIFKVI